MKLFVLFRCISFGLLLGFTILAGAFIGQQWHNYQHYQKLDKQLTFLQSSIKVIDRLSDERVYLNILLGATQENDVDLNELKRRQTATNGAIDQLSALIPTLRVPNNGRFYRSYERWLSDVKTMRNLTSTIFTSSATIHSSKKVQQLIQANMQLAQPVEQMLLLVSDNIVQQDSQYIHPVETLKALVSLRNQAGLLGSTLVPAIIGKRTLNQEEKAQFYQTKYHIEQLYTSFNYHLSWMIKHGMTINSVSKKNIDKKYFKEALPILDYLFLIGKQSGNYQINSKNFTEQYTSNLDSAKNLRYALLQERIITTQDLKQTAVTQLMLTILVSLLLGILILYCLKLIKSHFLDPLTEADYLLSIPDEALYKRTLLPVYTRRNEASQMLLKLHALRMKYFSDHKNEETP